MFDKWSFDAYIIHRPSRLRRSFSSGRSFPSGPRTLRKSCFLGLDNEEDDEEELNFDFAGEDLDWEELEDGDVALDKPDEGIDN